MKNDSCIFCKIANGEIPSKTLYEDEKFRVILDLGPATKGHALILPKDQSCKRMPCMSGTIERGITRSHSELGS